MKTNKILGKKNKKILLTNTTTQFIVGRKIYDTDLSKKPAQS